MTLTGIRRRRVFDITPDLVSRFWSKVSRGTDDECWEWMASLRSGYGAIKHGGHVLSAHVVSFAIARGYVPHGSLVTHTCDNRKCCNPWHLREGSFRDNVLEMHERGRANTPRACAVKTSMLTEDQVREIRRLRDIGMSHRKIASVIGIGRHLVTGVLSRGYYATVR